MAFADRALNASGTARGKTPRVECRFSQPKTFGPSAAGTLAHLTPVALNTSTGKWVVWDGNTAAGANKTGVIKGFIYAPREEAVTVDATDDTVHTVMLRGEISVNDVALPTGATLNDLKTVMITGIAGEPTLRELGIDVWED